MKKYFGYVILILCLLLTGCSNNAVNNENAAETPSLTTEIESQAVAEWETADSLTDEVKDVQLWQDRIYTITWDYDYAIDSRVNCKITEEYNGSINIKAEFDKGFLYFYAGTDGALYYLYEQDESCYLRKDYNDEVQYCKELVWNGQGLKDVGIEIINIDNACANSNGEICFNDNGTLYLFDNNGELKYIIEDTWEMGYQIGFDGLINRAGAIYLYRIESDRVALKSLDMSAGSLRKKEYILLEDSEILSILNGDGVYIADEECLWKEIAPGAELVKVLSWSDESINLDAQYVKNLSISAEGDLFLLYDEAADENMNLVKVEYKNWDEVPVRQRITIGCLDMGVIEELEKAVKQFNRQSELYYAELLVYEWRSNYEDFYMDLLMGEGADIYVLNEMPKEVMADKGVLEDLAPYFAASEVINEEDLLESVRNACYIDGKMVCVIPSFYMQGMLVEKGIANEGGWTYEDMIALAEKYPASKLAERDDWFNIFYNMLFSYVGSNIAWEDLECSFADEEFCAMLEAVKRVCGREGVTLPQSTIAGALYNKDYLSLQVGFVNVDDFAVIKETFGEYADVVGFPNEEGIPYYRMLSNQVYGINSFSDCKAGAWAFLEFLLSDGMQSELEYFSVREDVFNTQLEEGYSQQETSDRITYYTNPYTNERTEGNPVFTEGYANELAVIVSNMYYDDAIQIRTIQEIVMEELPAFFEADKTVEDVADIIENRVNLYLGELE